MIACSQNRVSRVSVLDGHTDAKAGLLFKLQAMLVCDSKPQRVMFIVRAK